MAREVKKKKKPTAAEKKKMEALLKKKGIKLPKKVAMKKGKNYIANEAAMADPIVRALLEKIDQGYEVPYRSRGGRSNISDKH